jgi:hypothetical protein
MTHWLLTHSSPLRIYCLLVSSHLLLFLTVLYYDSLITDPLLPTQYILSPSIQSPVIVSYYFSFRICLDQKDCPELGGCINSTIPCQPDIAPSSIVYKTVWYFEQLQTIIPSLFPSGNTIAITSVSNANGTLMYHNGVQWAPVSGISPSTALVVGKTDRIT